jgi:catechol 2,3-dioxygenase-like lactoylglutathione lyase family enzyme
MIERFDHVVLTVVDVETTLTFYERVLGMSRLIEPKRPSALLFGRQKINVHQADRTFEPKALRPTVGSADLCLVTEWAIDRIVAHLAAEGVAIELGPVERQGALGAMTSVYLRDPDGNLLEVSHYP